MRRGSVAATGAPALLLGVLTMVAPERADAFVPVRASGLSAAAVTTQPLSPLPGGEEGGITLVTHRAGKAASSAGSSGGWSSVSGLSWRSGNACWSSTWESYRNRKSDVYITFTPRNRWSSVVSHVKQYVIGKYKNKPGRLSLGLAMLTDDTRAQWQSCISGKFDQYMLEIGRALQSSGRGNSIIRLGWEANGSGFPWNIKGQVEPYKACFRRQVQKLKSVAPGLQIDWTMKKNTEGPVGAQSLYPGDQYVDIIGVNTYDRYPAIRTEADWNSFYNATHKGGPWGFGSWVQFAKSHGKKLSVPEWGIWNERPGGGDNPFYIQKMYDTFRKNASTIAYEGYFNCLARHQIHSPGKNPKASAKYRALWASGG
jgi:hypothetical protein